MAKLTIAFNGSESDKINQMIEEIEDISGVTNVMIDSGFEMTVVTNTKNFVKNKQIRNEIVDIIDKYLPHSMNGAEVRQGSNLIKIDFVTYALYPKK